MPHPGATLGGARLLEKIGEGHYGEVWKAEYLGQPVAIKIFTRPLRTSQLQREALAQYVLGRLEGLEAEYFPRVEHIDLDHEPRFLRMELVDGVSLEEALANPTLSLEERLALGQEVLRALAIVHQHGFVHGDLSPTNILVDRSRRVKLIDVGFGKLVDEPGALEVSSTPTDLAQLGVASPLYASPERFQGRFLEGCAQASDVFAFGKVLYKLATRESPYVVKPLTLKYPDLDPAWDQFLFRCLEERPESRFADALEALGVYAALPHGPRVVGIYRASCPSCGSRLEVACPAAGEVHTCPGCGASVEFDNLDPRAGSARAVLVATTEIALLEEIPEAVPADAVRFCPACGNRIKGEARKCRHCGVWIDEFERGLRERERDRAKQAAIRREYEGRDFWLPAFATFLAYLLCWLPGFVMNLHFLSESKRAEAWLGRPAAGAGALQFLMWLFVYLPILAFAGALFFGLLGSHLP